MASLPTVLSRASVYASLKSYDAPHANASSIPKNVQDSSLLSFWGHISNQMHRTIPRLDCKNTAGRPLSVADMTTRLQHRSLTLIGDGATKTAAAKAASITPNSSKKRATAQLPAVKIDRRSLVSMSTACSQPRAVLSKRHQRSKRRRLIRRIQAGIKTDRKCRTSVDTSLVNIDQYHSNEAKRQLLQQQQYQRLNCDAEFVQSLHAEWNYYARNLIQPLISTAAIGLPPDTAGLTTWMSHHMDAIELIGARVGIELCPMMVGYNSTTGIIVSQSTRVWNIVLHCYRDVKGLESNDRANESTVQTIESAGTVSTTETTSRTEQVETKLSESNKERRKPRGPLRVIQVPKKGTVFRVTIPLDAEETKSIAIVLSNV